MIQTRRDRRLFNFAGLAIVIGLLAGFVAGATGTGGGAILVPLANVLMATSGWNTVFWVAASMDAAAAILAILVLRPMRRAHHAANAAPSPV